MLAQRRSISFRNNEIVRTPLLVPSFSSKGFPDIKNIFLICEQVITESLLVSAYDVIDEHYDLPITCAEIIFLDSGGYECSKDTEFTELGYTIHQPKDWAEETHKKVIDSWPLDTPTVVITYDHPKKRCDIKTQISNAREFFYKRENIIKEILVKPETEKQIKVQLDTILQNIHQFAGFDIIGFTEKELGNTLLERMKNIALIRRALQKINLNIPIHIFGSLDTISTPLYFLSGADIFDGLTWLRFAYMDGLTVYNHNYGAVKCGITTKNHLINARVFQDNIRYLSNLCLEMRRFLNAREFGSFSYYSNLLENSYASLMEELKGV